MVVAVVTPVVFCAKVTEKINNNTKTSYLLSKSSFITMHCKTYCNSYITNCSMARAQVVAWPEPDLCEYLTAGCMAFSLANGKGMGTNDWVIRSLDD
jgi:hypothetical protein